MQSIAFDEILNQYDKKIFVLGSELREYLISLLPNIQEMPDAPANIIGYGYGPGYKDMICAIIPSKKGIKLGINRGSELPAPESLLTGSGKVHKYVEIKSEEVISLPALKHLLNEALNAYHIRMENDSKKAKPKN